MLFKSFNKIIHSLLILITMHSYANSTPLTQHINQFSVALFQHANTAEENLVISPFSVYSDFALLYPGAAGNTRLQMNNFFHFPDKLKTIDSLNRSLSSNNKQDILKINFSAWINNTFNILPSYQMIIQQTLQSSLFKVNFNQPRLAASTINNWVDNKTEGMIAQLLSPQDIQHAQLVLINTVFFNAMWALPFKAVATNKQPFYPSHKKIVAVKTMHQTHTFLYGSNKQLQALSLPYLYNKFSMLILLPKEGTNNNQLIKKLTAMKIETIINNLQLTKIALSIPKFKLQSKQNLKKILKKMGLTTPFNSNANFSNLAKTNLMIDKVIHETQIKVSETNTKAAAATAIIAVLTSSLITTPIIKPIVFNANHPFMFAIYDNSSHLIVFIGTFDHPQKIASA